jgi:8-oxo-dGTP diphosphatase
MEMWDLYDEKRNSIGQIHTRGIEVPSGKYHIVVEIFTVNIDGKILLTQRDPAKTYPLLWESTGGSITTGETSLEGAVRELREETGLNVTIDNLYKIGELKRGDYFVDSYIWKSNAEIKLNELKLQVGEVCDAKLVSLQELKKMNQEGLIVPTVWKRYELYRDEIKRVITQ